MDDPIRYHFRWVIAVFLMVMAAAAPILADETRSAGEQGLFGELLNAYVQDGVVNYKGFQTEEKKLDTYLGILERTDTSRLNRLEAFAFYINAYNAWTIKLILTAYPEIDSIWDLGGRFFNKPFEKRFIKLDQKTVSLDYIEHTILRPTFKDPRVHFAVNCASKSCPPLYPTPFRAETLEEQLDAATRAFINDPGKNYLKEDTLYVSKIFKWFSDDFDNDPTGFILKYASKEFEARIRSQKNLKVKYIDYNWSLNGH